MRKKLLLRNKLSKYNNLLIENIFSFFLKKRIDNRFLVNIFYKLFSIYQYIDNKLYIETEFKDEKNHYIPVFILDNFRINSNSGEIYQYIKCGEPPRKGVSIRKEAANIKNYYSTVKLKDGKKSNYVEKMLFANLSEKFAARVLKKFLGDTNMKLISLEENILATHAAFQYARTPAFLEQIKIYVLCLLEIKKVPREVFSNNGKEKLREIFESNSLDIKDKDVQDYFQKLMDEKVDTDKLLSQKLDNSGAIIRTIFTTIGSLIKKPLFDKTKIIIEADSPFFFILPDSGCIVVDTKDPDCRWPYGWDFFKKTKILLLPLTPTKCLVFHNNQQLDDTLKDLFRNIAIGSSYFQHFKYIYSDRKNVLIQENLNKL